MRVGDYIRRHHLALFALFVALGGTSIAAIKDPVGPDGDIDACYDKRTGALGLQKGKKCGKKRKPVSWSQAGPQGPQGPPGAAGTAGEARAYGLVQPGGLLTHSKNASVEHPQPGVYCISTPGISPTQTPILLSIDYQSSTMVQGVATLSSGADPLLPTSSSTAVAYWDSLSSFCELDEYEVRTGRQAVNPGTNELSVLSGENQGFAFAVP